MVSMAINRHALHFGPYRTPRFKYGAKVECEARGEVTIVKLTAARIPWPIGKTHRATSLVLYKDLVRAVKSGSRMCMSATGWASEHRL